MKHKILFLLFAFALLIPAAVFSEQLSKIGVIDLSAIVSNYYKESKAYRELDEMTRKYEDEKKSILDEIDQLENKKLDAMNQGDQDAALKIDNEIFNKKEYLKEYTRIKYNQLQKKRDTLLESPSFLSEILKEIRYIAESEGYSLIIRSKDPNLMWWSKEVDITDLVLERLRRRAQ